MIGNFSASALLLFAVFLLSSRIDSTHAKPKAAGGLFAHERAMAEAKSILALLGVKNPTTEQLEQMTENVKTTGLTLADLQQASVSDG
jgi:hypothetical protein